MQLASYAHHGAVLRHFAENLGDDVVGGDAFGFGFEIQNQPVTQRRRGHGLNIIKAHVETALGQRADFAGQQQALAAARAAAEAQILIGDRRGGFRLRMRRQHEAHGVILDVRCHRHLAHQFLQFDQRFLGPTPCSPAARVPSVVRVSTSVNSAADG